MIYVNSIMNSLYTTLSSNSTLVNSNVTVEMAEPLNSDPNKLPWVGVYYNGSEIVPRRIGGSTPWQATHDLRIYVEDQSHLDSQTANDNLQKLLFPVLAAVNSNRTLDGTILHMTDISVEPFELNIEEEGNFFVYEIIISGENEA